MCAGDHSQPLGNQSVRFLGPAFFTSLGKHLTVFTILSQKIVRPEPPDHLVFQLLLIRELGCSPLAFLEWLNLAERSSSDSHRETTSEVAQAAEQGARR
ncbi:hypothetical protein T265_02571 [Opisthorchis viverrini]|uniref:Uncharacterized protein n=1 Tax=Opisthorchis viverrini TaxID=6198 RepID=A0A075AI70_OPIVI|nr:hypothetical protein T265_02571 [Opisthorchis viverrini]KER31119.1 hypothetical protein T265_02571 [Opisthorchis viverrini]